MSALAFANAGMLVALLALPVIWYFLRLMPPKPRLEQFPPTRLLLEIARKEEQPARSPWWLTALRLALCAAVIFALAGPVFKPTAEQAPGSGPLLLVVDNGWASAPHWRATLDTAHRIVSLAQTGNRPVALLATAEAPNQSLAPADFDQIRQRLDALAPRPWPARYAELVPAVADAARTTAFGGVAWLSDGMGGDDVKAFAQGLAANVKGDLLAYADAPSDLVGLKPPVGTADALAVTAIRRPVPAPGATLIRATDIQGRVIGEVQADFAAGADAAVARFTLPVELRNEIARLEAVGSATAGSVQLLDDRWRRRRIGLLSGASVETAQPLLSPLYYLTRAVSPFADVRQPRDANAAVAVPELIESGTSVIAMADIGVLTPDVEEKVADWVRNGGVLVRFAGPRLASAADALVPVVLRQGDRVLGGSLSWQTPQPLASFSANSPFAGLAVPSDVLVKRQVLAEPSASLADRTWAALADGTPLVTAAPSGKGWLVLFHVSADMSWSNLPLSGAFVDMLRRIIAFSSAARTGGASTNLAQAVPPYRLLDGFGHFTAPTAEAEPLLGDISDLQPGVEHPPGLYGSEDGFRAVNLLGEDATLPAFDAAVSGTASVRPYPTAAPLDIAPWLIGVAVALLALDALAVLWLNGALRFFRGRRAATAAALLVLPAVGLAAALALGVGGARAQDAGYEAALRATDKTHLAYVITGDPTVDETSAAGLRGLSSILAERTALEPGDPIGVDPARDELTFFPLIYWAIAPNAAVPTPATMARIDAYMRQGGSVLFDTRDQLERATQVNTLSGTPEAERLREMLAGLDIPPLEPVPADHVLTKAFYLLNDFPGRYAGGPLWVQLTESEDRADRPVQAGDGVSPILITENDFAGAWATDSSGRFMYPTVPADPLQREMAVRTGINIVMYTLTGNYKADQVHVPALLERLGQ
jgi:hypothetical protein